LPAEQRELAEEYHAAVYLLKDFYSKCSMHAVGIEHVTTGGPLTEEQLARPGTRTEWVYMADGDSLRLEETVFEAHDESQDDSQDSTRWLKREVGIIRPDESFLLGYDFSTQKHFLKAHGKDRDQYMGMVYARRFTMAPFTTGSLPIDNIVFVQRDDFRVTSITPATDDPNKIILEIGFKTVDETAQAIVELNRTRRWAVERAVMDVLKKTSPPIAVKYSFNVTYADTDIDGFPAMSKALYEVRSGESNGDELPLRFRQEIEITDLKHVIPDASVFDVERLIPQFERVGERTAPTTRRWILIANGVVLLAFGLLFASRRGRSKASEPKVD